MTTLKLGATAITPHLVNGYSSERTTGNIIHEAADDPSLVDVTFRPAGLRTGTLELLFLTLSDALAAENLHAEVGIFDLVDSDLPGLNMSYVPNGTIVTALDDETRKLWTVSVDFQEV